KSAAARALRGDSGWRSARLPSPWAAGSARFSPSARRRVSSATIGRKTTRRPRRPPLLGPSRDRSARQRAGDRPRVNEAMTYAAITGWGKCMPPSILTNAGLASLMETDDEWITSRTGIKERRVSHVTGIELAHVASAHALACAGLDAKDVDFIVYG